MWWCLSAFAQVVQNPGLQASANPPAVPNPAVISVPGWSLGGGAAAAPDVAMAGVPIDCASILSASSDGGHFVRATAVPVGPDVFAEALSTDVSGLVPGLPHRVRFEASIVRHFGQSSGAWEVTLGEDTVVADPLVLPIANPGQQAWVVQQVDFVPTTTAASLRFVATSLGNGTTNSPALDGTGDCPYTSALALADLLIDGIQVVADTDMDGWFDDEDVCPDLPNSSGDSDMDLLPDEVEQYQTFTDPCWADTDGDGLVDGLEIENGCDPLEPDTDGDAVDDFGEVAAGTDCAEPPAPPVDEGGQGTGDTGDAKGHSTRGWSRAVAGRCDCATSAAPSLAALVPILASLVAFRRGRRRR